jgi:hypothetical protein
MSPSQRTKVTQRYQTALQRYKERMTSLDKARQDKKADYFPDWLSGPRRFSDGSNRFFPQGIMKGKDPVFYETKTEQQLSQYPDAFAYVTDPLLLSAMQIEMARFVSESDLANLLKF